MICFRDKSMKRKRGQSNLFDELQKTDVKLQKLD